MTVDIFEQLSARRLAAIEQAKLEKATALFFPEHRWEHPVYLVGGEEVTKETFILKSDMEHLLPDVSTVGCSRCGRRESPQYWHQHCGMSLASGTGKCDGVFF
jgi:hypothetical protein